MENIKEFTIGAVFIFVCSVSILFFALAYPSLNGHTSVLSNDARFNQTATNLSILLGNYQDTANSQTNTTIQADPTIDAQSLQLVPVVSTSRTTLSQLSESFVLITTLLGSVFGLSGGQFTAISGALISLFAIVLLYYVVKVVRWGQ